MPQFKHNLLKNPALKYPAIAADQPFSHYISACENLIRTHRVDLAGNPKADWIVKANSPFELAPSRVGTTGVLMIHGLFDSPFGMRDIAVKLQAQGLLVQAILLPGHGTVPGALLTVHYTEWLQTVAQGVQKLLTSCEKIFIFGYSTGASLALHHLLQQPEPRVAGLILLAPALTISPLAKIAWLPPKLQWLSEKMAWFAIGSETDYTRYQSFTYNSIYQVRLLAAAIKKLVQSRPLTTPMLFDISLADETVNSRGTLEFFRRFTQADSRLILYTNTAAVKDPRIIPRPARYPEWRIENISHISLPIAPKNSYYGMHGEYPDASRVEENIAAGKKIIYVTSVDTRYEFLNWLHRHGWYEHTYERLTFNPDFTFLQEMVSQFIAEN
jgi:esterase/lipase